MAKRFFETELWKESWFRKLPPKYKLFLYYIHAQCDQAGIWPVDFELASFSIGTRIERMDTWEQFKHHLIAIDNEKWILKDFNRFQYGENLNPASGPHKKVIQLLKENTRDGRPLLDTLMKELHIALKDMEKDMVKDTDRDKSEVTAPEPEPDKYKD